MRNPTFSAMAARISWALMIHSTALVATAQAACINSGHAIEYGGTICLNGVCIPLHQRWHFLGTHIYVYPDLPAARGIIWDKTKAVDMVTNGSDPFFLPHITTRESQTALAKVELLGDDVSLSRHVEVRDTRGQLEADTWLRIVVRMEDCHRCTLVTYDMSGESGYLPSQSTLSGTWCQVAAP